MDCGELQIGERMDSCLFDPPVLGGIFLIGGFARMRYIGRMDELTRDHGPQPLDGLMVRWNLNNHELVEVSEEQLNHKQVQKARKGRQLTARAQKKVLAALNGARKTRDLPAVGHEAAFNYIGR